MTAKITTVGDLLDDDELAIPIYQRPYKWQPRNVLELLDDINGAIESEVSAYRIGTVILHDNGEGKDIVDGQQRLITLALVKCYCVGETLNDLPPLLKSEATLKSKTSRCNAHDNYAAIADWFAGFTSERQNLMERFKNAFYEMLEAFVIIVEEDKLSEAFQLFDSQNSRGRDLDPHDLLKAYHLRAMGNHDIAMRRAVGQWEDADKYELRELFAVYLARISDWSQGRKTRNFTAQRIDMFKGVPMQKNYPYGQRARHALPFFQIGHPFVEGEEFFAMTSHYLQLVKDVEASLENENLKEIRYIYKHKGTTGYSYASKLFELALVKYYDKFGEIDLKAAGKLCAWAFMLRVDMNSLGFDSVNKYAIGENEGQYTNSIDMFAAIERARVHTEIGNMKVSLSRKELDSGSRAKDEREKLLEKLKELLGTKER